MIKTTNLHKSFGKLEVLKGIDIDINPGEVVVLVGVSGSGKSTLLRCLNFLEKAEEGTISIDGRTVDRKKDDLSKVRAEVGMVFQHFNLFPHKTVLENIMEAPLIVKKEDKEKAKQRHSPFWIKSVFPIRRMSIRINYRVDRSNVSPSRGRLQWNRKRCYSTNRRPHSIRNSSGKY